MTQPNVVPRWNEVVVLNGRRPPHNLLDAVVTSTVSQKPSKEIKHRHRLPNTWVTEDNGSRLTDRCASGERHIDLIPFGHNRWSEKEIEWRLFRKKHRRFVDRDAANPTVHRTPIIERRQHRSKQLGNVPIDSCSDQHKLRRTITMRNAEETARREQQENKRKHSQNTTRNHEH